MRDITLGKDGFPLKMEVRTPPTAGFNCLQKRLRAHQSTEGMPHPFITSNFNISLLSCTSAPSNQTICPLTTPPPPPPYHAILRALITHKFHLIATPSLFKKGNLTYIGPQNLPFINASSHDDVYFHDQRLKRASDHRNDLWLSGKSVWLDVFFKLYRLDLLVSIYVTTMRDELWSLIRLIDRTSSRCAPSCWS